MNISREHLQDSAVIRRISKILVQRVIKWLAEVTHFSFPRPISFFFSFLPFSSIVLSEVGDTLFLSRHCQPLSRSPLFLFSIMLVFLRKENGTHLLISPSITNILILLKKELLQNLTTELSRQGEGSRGNFPVTTVVVYLSIRSF